MITFYNFLAGLGGGIIAIVSAIGIPFIRKIIFKLFESKVDERANKAISDHNAKNDTKIHISKALFDLEQQAIENSMRAIGEMSIIVAEIGGHISADVKYNRCKLDNKDFYIEKTKLLLNTLSEYKKQYYYYAIYTPEKIEEEINKIVLYFSKFHNEVSLSFSYEDLVILDKKIDELVNILDNNLKEIKKLIQERYNNIKII